jgi:hypothetical protein
MSGYNKLHLSQLIRSLMNDGMILAHNSRTPKEGINSLVALGAWIIWTHRNACAFDGVTPSMSRALSATSDEQRIWEIAGAQSLSSLTGASHEE